ncbi:2OG-Fe(II) oxygenase family oxidoreductase [Colletotrichum tabaci]|uniref:2OG-Fe(II) oxygenase family oxidoreductase n=1 Tax=Colletotrichum tabaci TaxID=1209068 RepID=A0AAV9SSS5_9PEZI
MTTSQMESARFEGPNQGDVADLSVLSIQKLLSNDAEETIKLFSACSEWGFFYLDLASNATEPYRASTDHLQGFAVQYFNQPLEEKMQDTNEAWETINICGYKPRSLDTGNVEGKKDGCEGLRLPADVILLRETPLQFPRGAEMHRNQTGTFIEQSHAIAILILSRLSDSLGLTGASRLENLHRADRPSTSTAVMQHYPFEGDLPADTSTGHFAHTDTGSVTILFNTEWGLQVCSPYSEEWKYVPPAKGTRAVVNIGDTVKFLTAGRLKSCLHRVVPYLDRWTRGSRYAIIFFLRANNDVEFEDIEGRRWNAKDWLNRKFLNYRSPHEVQKQNPMATV